MTLDSNFQNGDTDYIPRLNANFSEAEGRIAANEQALAVSGFDLSTALRQIFDRNGVVGDETVVPAITGGDSIAITSTGTATPPGLIILGGVPVQVSDQTVAATGGAGTRYAQIASNGALSVDAALDGAKLLVATASWDGAVLSGLVDSRVILFDGDDYQDCLDSAVLGLTFSRLADRLENVEALAGGGVVSLDFDAKITDIVTGVGAGTDTPTGQTFWNYSGTGATNQIAGIAFRIPDDYVSGGRFRWVVSPGATDTGNVRFQVTTIVLDDATDIFTPQDVDEALDYVPGGSAGAFEKTPYITPTVSAPLFAAGKWVNIALKRIGNDASDANNDDQRVLGMEFEYTRG